MKLKIIGSSSAGNSYLLDTNGEALIIECGVRFDNIKKALNFNLSKIMGCLISHEHQDHSKSAAAVAAAGINIYASEGTIKAMGINSHRMKSIKEGIGFKIGGFKIKAFAVKHDAAQPLGFLIYHKECGNVLFLTDTYYSEYTFRNLNNIIVEANHDQTILDERAPTFLRNRIMESHMNIETCKDFLKANDLSKVNNIVLIHLSNANSDEQKFKIEIEDLSACTVHVADSGMEIELNKTPF